MLPSNTRLFTWIDAEEVIQTALEKSRWPDGLIWVRAYWDGLTVGIRPGKKKDLVKWLSSIFEPRFDNDGPAIILESKPDSKRLLDIVFEETTEAPPQLKFRPRYLRTCCKLGA